MSEPIYPDPAAPVSGGVGVSAPAASPQRVPRDGLLAKLARRWWLVAACLLIALVGSFIYLVTAEKAYTASCVIAAESAFRGTPAGDVPPDEFLYEQRDIVRSAQVLAAAATALIKSEVHVREATEVAVSTGEGLITIRYRSPRPDDAARGANAVAEAYLRVRGQQAGGATAGLAELAKQREKLTADRAMKESSIREAREAAAGGDAQRIAAARLEQLQQAVTDAEAELVSASAAAAAGKELLADPGKLRSVVEAHRGDGVFDRLEAQRTRVESERTQAAEQMERLKESVLPQHPAFVATQKKLEQRDGQLAALDKQYGGVYLAHLEQQRATAQKKVDELKHLIDEQSILAKDYLARAAKLAELEAAMKKTDVAIAEIDAKLRDATLAGSGGSGGPSVEMVMPAQPPTRPSSPDRDRTILTASSAGLIAGLFLAAVWPRRRS